MINNINLHLEEDESKQASLDERLANFVLERQHANINALLRTIPSTVEILNGVQLSNFGIFINKFEHINIVDYSLGRTLYGFNPEKEISEQVCSFLNYPLYVRTNEEAEDFTPDALQKQPAANLSLQHLYSKTKKSKDIDVLVVLGLGLGHHLYELIANANISHLVIYEPELQYFKCSSLVFDWKRFLTKAKETNTAIYLQVGKDGRNLVDDINELSQHFDVDGFYVFKHYSHPMFNSLYQQVLNFSWTEILQQGVEFKAQKIEQYCPRWANTPDYKNISEPSVDESLFQKNLDAFKRYYPDIFKEFENYQPKIWAPYRTNDGEMNLLNNEVLCSWHFGSAKEELLLGFENYSQQPNKDGIALGYKGQKLKHYEHYKFVKKTEHTLEKVKEEIGSLPDDIKSMIMFGLGLGYQLEALFESHTVENLFLCEPSRDFFYASLFSIKWFEVLEKIDASGARLYINIGDDGTNLFRDLLSQFYSIGPYILASTYFYQSYYNSSLNSAIAQLREQLYVVILMGEYYDHAKFGIAHTKYALENNLPHLCKDPSSILEKNEKEVPIFLVGNGPSLDYSIDEIRANSENAIIVSCGTALQVLHKHGISPDFHAEIEQNRSTFDWISRIGDKAYLKSLTLISANGVHPDTVNLFGETLIAFKEGESSTVSTLAVLGEGKYETLQFAFPTVSNFAINLFSQMGFREIYLFGVDLGFIDDTKHHSGQSGYYDKNGKQLYDYREKNNTSHQVEGNFRSKVYTKDEFKVAKMVMEQSLRRYRLDCYNTSDGAKIAGSVSLKIDDVLVLTSSEQKSKSVNSIKSNVYKSIDPDEFVKLYQTKFEHDRLLNEISVVVDRVGKPVETRDEAESLINTQKQMLFSSYQKGASLLFYLLYGTTNYANAVMSKTVNASEQFNADLFNEIRESWLAFLTSARTQIETQLDHFDVSSTLVEKRVNTLLGDALKQSKVLIVSDELSVLNSARFFAKRFEIECTPEVIQHADFRSIADEQAKRYDAALIFCSQSTASTLLETVNIAKSAGLDSEKCIFVVTCWDKDTSDTISGQFGRFFLSPGDFRDEKFPRQSNDWYRVADCLRNLDAFNYFKVVMQRFDVTEGMDLDCLPVEELAHFHLYQFGNLVGGSMDALNTNTLIFENGAKPSEVDGHNLDETLTIAEWSSEKRATFVTELVDYFYMVPIDV